LCVWVCVPQDEHTEHTPQLTPHNAPRKAHTDTDTNVP